MSDLFSSLSFASSGMEAQAKRLRLTSENIANADTPGYRRKTTDFHTNFEGHLTTGKVRLDQTELQQIYDPGHPLADTNGHYRGSNVDMVVEIADAREAQRSYEANLKMFDQARQMTMGLLELLKR